MKRAILILFALLVLAGCGRSHSNPVYLPKSGVMKVSCMDMAQTQGQCVNSKARSMASLDIFTAATTTLVSHQTVTTTFDGGDLSITQYNTGAVLNMTIQNGSDTLFTGYVISHIFVGGFDLGLAGMPLSLQPGQSVSWVEGAETFNGMTTGPNSISARIYATDPTFTVENSNLWTAAQIEAWVAQYNPVPAAVGIIYFNIVP